MGSTKRTHPDSNSRVYRTDLVIAHSLYNDHTLDNDIALLRVPQGIQYTDYIQPACVADSAYNISRAYECYTSGWGAMNARGGETGGGVIFGLW